MQISRLKILRVEKGILAQTVSIYAALLDHRVKPMAHLRQQGTMCCQYSF